MKAEEIRKLAENLLGTADILDSDVTDAMTIEELAELDRQVALCECCSWWCEACEMNDDGWCEDCAEHNAEWDNGE